MDTITIFDQNISFLVLLQLNRRESDGYVDVLVVWNGPVVDDLQQLELLDAHGFNAPNFLYGFH